MKYILFLLPLFVSLVSVFQCMGQSAEQKIAFANYHKYYKPEAQTNLQDKKSALLKFREYYGKRSYRSIKQDDKLDWKACLQLLSGAGIFKDLAVSEKDIAGTVTEAYNRLWKIAEAFRNGKFTPDENAMKPFLKAVVFYGNKEVSRPNNSTRFHASCFAIPTAAVNIYFCLLNQMNAVEEAETKDSLMVEVCDMLKVVSLQAWTQPFRNDSTDLNIVQEERFRHHVWWVGGNGLAYRPLLPVACMFRSVAMLDLLAEVSVKGISTTSQTTYNDAYWTEGLTADGAGWGHGKQCLIWGYPIDGTNGAFTILNFFRGTPWAKELAAENKAALLNFFHGGNWYYYKGFNLPCLDRYSMRYNNTPKAIPYLGIINNLMKDWSSSFSTAELTELRQLQQEASANFIEMKQYPDGMYNGTRWFYNNDDLVKKNNDYHLIVNMASSRCDGVESAPDFADGYNFYTADGMTLFQKSGKEYRSIYGAWDVTASPGVTAREGMGKLTPVTNWRGYNSRYNFAVAATSGGENSAAGFIFEKQNASEREDVNDKGNNQDKNEILYGVSVYKSYFIVGDYLIALGAGVTNLKPAIPGSIRTTIDQTALEGEITLIEDEVEKPAMKNQPTSFVSKSGHLVWIKQQNKFAYAVLPQLSSKAWYVCESKRTDWVKMNNTNKEKTDLPQTANILRLWVDHGQRPVNDTYGYAVYMGSGKPAASLPVNVLKNDTMLQAVQSVDKKMLGAVFYRSTSRLKTDGFSLSVSAPCAVLLEKDKQGFVITVTDAEMNSALNEIILTLNGKQISFEMPKGKDCGRPVTKKVSE